LIYQSIKERKIMIKITALFLLCFSLFCSASFAEEAAKSSVPPVGDNSELKGSASFSF